MAHRLAPEARAALDGIWAYIVRESGNAAAADSVIDAVTERFNLLSEYPRMGRAREDLRSGLRSTPVGQYVIVTPSKPRTSPFYMSCMADGIPKS